MHYSIGVTLSSKGFIPELSISGRFAQSAFNGITVLKKNIGSSNDCFDELTTRRLARVKRDKKRYFGRY